VLLGMDPIPDIPLDPATLSRDRAVGEAYAADELVYHGPLHRTTLETIFAAVEAIGSGPKLELPTLWLHGEEDALAPYEVTKEAMRRIRTEQVLEKSYPGAMHEIFNETNQEEVLVDALAFIGQHTAAPV
jgi:alpha-beta hydrolase superfamily lysophospholipase